jgi:hypothetical protein
MSAHIMRGGYSCRLGEALASQGKFHLPPRFMRVTRISAHTVENIARAIQAMPPSARRFVEEAIELLPRACDEMDGDPDREGEADPKDAGARPLSPTEIERRYSPAGR